ncbi:MAG: hypothetical protein DBX55_04635 [Verrucomicrobia bacterium]|nr:MAG: hypothetical protein DBX55_04635 [Verrucomicrobiota bacterium]
MRHAEYPKKSLACGRKKESSGRIALQSPKLIYCNFFAKICGKRRYFLIPLRLFNRAFGFGAFIFLQLKFFIFGAPDVLRKRVLSPFLFAARPPE